MKKVCTSCGTALRKTALHDPYLCRLCEKGNVENIYAYLDAY